MSRFEDRFAKSFNRKILNKVGEDVVFLPLNVGGNSKIIKAEILRETETSNLNQGNPDDLFDIIEVRIRSEDNTVGHVTIIEWGRADGSGDTMIFDAQLWYVVNHLERAVAGLHRLRLANSLAAVLDQ